MLSKEISSRVLSIGCSYKHPKGGVAQVMKNYEDYIYPEFKCVVNSGGNNKIEKLLRAIGGWLEMLVKLLFDRQIKIVHIHTASYNSFKRSAIFLKLAKWFGKKTILHIHGGGFKEYYATNRQWIANTLNCCDAIITLSESWKSFYQSITSDPKIYVLENIIANPNITKFEKSPKCKFLFLGKIDQLKGVYDLIEVLNQNKASLADKVEFHMGGGGEVDKLKDLISKYELESFVFYEGFVSGHKKEMLLNLCDAYILPSYTEGLPVSILEAMSYGKPILATPVGGIPEVVIDNGILFQPGDLSAIYKTVDLIANDASKRRQMGLKSKEMIEAYLPANVERKLQFVYSELQK
ncbi:glycosyltransferase family 4 protein [Phocaeicola vulgatus]|uniref:glycosyltransferase family 4 protein n=1 Tax=Phocaeicola vulgatus TaxID=821 RepID=UPI001E28C2D9|nr:glycosyltransferase family 4 protein [Phocaeicola vulgatus]